MGFFEKIDVFFEKKLDFHPNRWRCQICRRMRIKWYYFLKMSFQPFLAKFQKIFEVENLRDYDDVFSRKKKRFHLLKSLLYKNGKADKNAGGFVSL